MPDTNPIVVQVTTILSHDTTSTGPAFFVSLEEAVYEILSLVFPYHIESTSNLALTNKTEMLGLSTVLSFQTDVLPLGEEINLTYLGYFNLQANIERNISEPITVNYTTIKQEGIGLMVQ